MGASSPCRLPTSSRPAVEVPEAAALPRGREAVIIWATRDHGRGAVNAQDPRLMTITTAPQLADYLNVNEKKLRSWLRKDFPEHAPGQGDEWALTPEMNRRMVERAGRA